MKPAISVETFIIFHTCDPAGTAEKSVGRSHSLIRIRTPVSTIIYGKDLPAVDPYMKDIIKIKNNIGQFSGTAVIGTRKCLCPVIRLPALGNAVSGRCFPAG